MSSTFTDGFLNKPKRCIPELPKDKCILDFSKDEIGILQEIKKIVENELDELEQQIATHQELIMNRGKTKVQPEEIQEPTPKELFEFKTRLEETFLKSGQDFASKVTESPSYSKSNTQLPALKNEKLKGTIKIISKARIECAAEPVSKSKFEQPVKFKLSRAATTNAVSRKKIKLKSITKANESYTEDDDGMNKSATSVFIRKIKDKPNLNINKKSSIIGNEKPEGSIYGLDADFLREIGKQDLIEEYEQDKVKMEESRCQTPAILALEYKYKKVSKLREICKELRDHHEVD